MDNKRIIKVMLILMVISAILFFYTPKTYAGLASNMMGTPETQGNKPVTPEQEHHPTPPPGDPDPEPEPDPDPDPDPEPEPEEPKVIRKEDFVVTEYRYRFISGYVYEDLGRYTQESGDTAYSGSTLGVAQVKVTAKSGSKTYSTLTDSSGYFEFKDMDEGEYNLEFRYGDVNVLESEEYGVYITDPASTSNILKYNGYDYIVTKTPTATTEGDFGSNSGSEESTGVPGLPGTINVISKEVVEGGKGVVQLYLVIDSSYSAHTTIVTMADGTKKTRLEVEIEAAKKLIEDILKTGNNIYIGIVSFSGDTHVTSGLSKDEYFLDSVLERVAQIPYVPGTNIIKALETANSLFYNKDPETSNRAIVVISDCLPTISYDTVLYSDDTEQEILDKLYNNIGPSTKECVMKLIEDKVNMMALIIDSEDQEEVEYADSIFKIDGVNCIRAEDGTKLANTIQKDIKDWIIKTKVETDVVVTPGREEIEGWKKEWSGEWREDSVAISGCEDAERRAKVDSYFKNKFYYNHPTDENDMAGQSILLKEIDEPSDISKIKKLSEHTYMTANAGPYRIDSPDIPEDYVIVHEDIDSNGDEYTYREIHKYIATGYSDQNMILARRPSITFNTTITITDLRIVLSTGEVLSKRNEKVGSTSFLMENIDPDIAHGATLELEYTISVKNDSSLQCNHLELITYLPDNLMYADKGVLISNPELTNHEMGWAEVDLETEFNNGYISKDTLNKYDGREVIKLIRDNGGKGKDGFFIPPGREFTTKVMVSKVMDTNLVAIKNQADAEVLGYITNNNRRATYNIKGAVDVVKGEFPANMNEPDFSASTNQVAILPPTGSDNYNVIKILTIVLSTTMLLAVGIIIKIKKIKKST